MRFYLIRHAATALNSTPGFQGRIDTELSEAGLKQAIALQSYFKRIPLDFLYSSPLKRAVQTARQIQLVTALPILPAEDLIEIDFGEWDGLSHAEADKLYGEPYRNFYYHPSEYPFPGEISLEYVKKRVKGGMESIIRESTKDASVAIVTHGGILRIIILTLLQMDLKYYRNLRFDNAGISIVDYVNGESFIQSLNDTCHLHS